MSDLILRSTVKAHTSYHNLRSTVVETVKRLGEEQTGQDLIEYGGIILIIAAILAALFTLNVPQNIAQDVSNMVSNVFSTNGNTPAG